MFLLPPTPLPPPAATLQHSEPLHAPLLAEPGTPTAISNRHLNTTILARSTHCVGILSHPIHISLSNCTLTARQHAPQFFISNARAEITLSNCHGGSRNHLLLCLNQSAWGKYGYNGASVHLQVKDSHLKGDIYVGKNCSIELTLKTGSSWSGRFCGPGHATIRKHHRAVWAQQPIFLETPQNTTFCP